MTDDQQDTEPAVPDPTVDDPAPSGDPAGPSSRPAPSDPINRVAARILDIVVWALLLVPLGILVSGGSILDPEPDVGRGTQAAATILGVALVAAYETVLVGWRGGTLGKLAVRAITRDPMRVVRADGSPAGYAAAAARISPFVVLQGLAGLLGDPGQVLIIATWALATISVVLLFTDRRRQAVWDKIAGTLVAGGALREGDHDDPTHRTGAGGSNAPADP